MVNEKSFSYLFSCVTNSWFNACAKLQATYPEVLLFPFKLFKDGVHLLKLQHDAFQFRAHCARLSSSFRSLLFQEFSFLTFKIFHLLFEFLPQLLNICFILAYLFEEE